MRWNKSKTIEIINNIYIQHHILYTYTNIQYIYLCCVCAVHIFNSCSFQILNKQHKLYTRQKFKRWGIYCWANNYKSYHDAMEEKPTTSTHPLYICALTLVRIWPISCVKTLTLNLLRLYDRQFITHSFDLITPVKVYKVFLCKRKECLLLMLKFRRLIPNDTHTHTHTAYKKHSLSKCTHYWFIDAVNLFKHGY